jgi:UDP-2,3-diacylglucosamine pyrophosphatase LpxH
VADIRYVVVSDLHLGAENSVLTSLIERPEPPGGGAGGPSSTSAQGTGFEADPATHSPVLQGLVDALRVLTRHQAKRPTLILAGDVVDLALSPDEVSATVFSGFVSLALGESGVFDSVVYYLPGNHDHHLWESARESQYATYLRQLPLGQELAAPWHTTRLRAADESPKVGSEFLGSLIQRQPGCADVELRVVYPNLALLTPDGDRCVVVSHGHFTESIYTLMSQLKDILYPDQRPPKFNDIAMWEGENFAWIDFLWSTLGQSGQVGADLGLVYADLTNPKDLDALVANLARGLLAKGKGGRWLHPVEERALNFVFRREANHLARTERGTPDVTLSPATRQGLQRYLEDPVLDQLKKELGQVPRDVTFVFGHTHKPFVEQWPVIGYKSPVKIFNTGGWVVDTATTAPSQGGVAVLVDDELDAVSLQLYRQGGGAVAVQLLAQPDGTVSGSRLREQVAAMIDPAVPPWSTLAVDAARLVDQRHRLQAAVAAQRQQS